MRYLWWLAGAVAAYVAYKYATKESAPTSVDPTQAILAELAKRPRSLMSDRGYSTWGYPVVDPRERDAAWYAKRDECFEKMKAQPQQTDGSVFSSIDFECLPYTVSSWVAHK